MNPEKPDFKNRLKWPTKVPCKVCGNLPTTLYHTMEHGPEAANTFYYLKCLHGNPIHGGCSRPCTGLHKEFKGAVDEWELMMTHAMGYFIDPQEVRLGEDGDFRWVTAEVHEDVRVTIDGKPVPNFCSGKFAVKKGKKK